MHSMASGTINNTFCKSGTANYNDAYFNTPIYNFYEQQGQVVHFHFHAEVKAEVPNNSAVIAGLPKPIHDFRFTVEICDDQYANNGAFPRGCYLNNGGTIAQFYLAPANVGKYAIYDVVYMTSE